MPSVDDIVSAAAGEERDVLWRATTEDIEALRSGPGLLHMSKEIEESLLAPGRFLYFIADWNVLGVIFVAADVKLTRSPIES